MKIEEKDRKRKGGQEEREAESQRIDRADLSAARQPGRRLSLCCHSLDCRHLTPPFLPGWWRQYCSCVCVSSCVVCVRSACVPVCIFTCTVVHFCVAKGCIHSVRIGYPDCAVGLSVLHDFQGLRCGVSAPLWN